MTDDLNQPTVGTFAVRWVPTEQVTRYKKNPRRNASAVAKVRASLDEFGWRQPIVVDDAFVIIVGDTRYLAALERGDVTVPVHVASELTPAQVRAYRIADNRTHEEADWDLELLADELGTLEVESFDLSLTGFDDEEIHKLLGAGVDAPTLEAVDVRALPTMTWVLIGIETSRFIEIAEDVERVSAQPDVFVEVVAAADHASAHRKAHNTRSRKERPETQRSAEDAE